MRSLIFAFALFGAVFGKHLSTRMEGFQRILETEILGVSECIRQHLNDGDPEYDIPSFNPLHESELHLDFSELGIPDYLDGLLDITDVDLAGITTWDFVNLEGSISLIPIGYVIKFDVKFDPISGQTHYHADKITIDKDTEVFGDGDVKVSLTGLELSGKLVIGIGDNGIKLEDVQVKLAVDDIDLTVTGLDDDEELSQQVSDYFSNDLEELIKTKPDEVSQMIEDAIKDLFDGVQNSDVGNSIIDIVAKNCLGDGM